VPDFEGIPSDLTYPAPPANCTQTGTNSGDTLVLTLGVSDKALLLSGKDGKLQINGVTCTGVANPKTVQITGTATAETIVLDFSIGALPESLRSGNITIDVGVGGSKDKIAIAATRDGDQLKLGTKDGATLIKFGSGLPTLSIKNQEELVLSAGPGDDSISAMGGDDVGAALASVLTLYAGAGNDSIQGGAAADVLHGGPGDDAFNTGTAADGGDTFDGGDGVDTLSYELRKNAITLTVDRVANDGETNEKDSVGDNIETLIGGEGDDKISAGDADNTIIGGPGNDTLFAGKGDDMFKEPSSEQGSDVMNGGEGSDSIDYSERTASLAITLCIGTPASCTGLCACGSDDGEDQEYDALVNIENVYGGRGDDSIRGSSADNRLLGGDGNDELFGDDGNDTIYGDSGNDSLYGGADADLLDDRLGRNAFDGGDSDGDICILGNFDLSSNCEIK
jgi:Ca2+-binding RTX toxin-like protein